MGLYVHNIGNIPADHTRRFFVYVLDYGWHEPLTDTLMMNFRNMARMASETQSVVVAGIDPIHFANDVFSWHQINGEDGAALLPAIMITTLHPKYFREHNKDGEREPIDDTLLLIPLKKACKTTDDVIELIKSVFADIRKDTKLSGFSIAQKLKSDGTRRLANVIILKPSIAGIGVDLKELAGAFRKDS